MMRRVLEREERHFGFPCAPGTMIDGEHRSGTLARDVVWRGIVLPAGSTFEEDPDTAETTRVSLAAPTLIHGHLFASGTVVHLPIVPPPVSAVFSALALPLYPMVGSR